MSFIPTTIVASEGKVDGEVVEVMIIINGIMILLIPEDWEEFKKGERVKAYIDKSRLTRETNEKEPTRSMMEPRSSRHMNTRDTE